MLMTGDDMTVGSVLKTSGLGIYPGRVTNITTVLAPDRFGAIVAGTMWLIHFV